MNIQTERQQLLEQIRLCADSEYQATVRRTVPTELKVYGLRVPQLRDIARAWGRAHQQIAHDDLVALVDSLWNGESREERMLFTYLLEHYKHLVPDLTRAQFERWRRGLDNWEMTDGLGWVMALWLLADPDTRLDYLGELIADEDVWSRRLALVATVPINRGHTDFTIPDLTLQLVDRVKEERHPMITKAVSWALREMTKSHPDQVAAYLEKNREVLAAHVVREVDNKLRTGLKSGKTSSGEK
ncbi:MAG: DNA alkylation repair protein [Anaerolineales bacterium]|nr:DNA alkylation repair protein [Anaerolineales bacterium]